MTYATITQALNSGIYKSGRSSNYQSRIFIRIWEDNSAVYIETIIQGQLNIQEIRDIAFTEERVRENMPGRDGISRLNIFLAKHNRKLQVH